MSNEKISKPNSDNMLHDSPDVLIKDVSTLIDEARAHIAHEYNSTQALLCWFIGKRINEEILKSERAEYGETIVVSLSKHLALSYGKGYSRPNLFRMIKFAKAFPNRDIVSTLSRQLTWSHFVLICAIDDDLKRDFYAEMCRVQRWTVRALQKQLKGMLYERIALSKQPESVIKYQLDKLNNTDEMTPDLTFKDPFRQVIRGMFGFREPTDADSIAFIHWCIYELLPKMPQEHEIKTALRIYYQLAKIEPFSDKQQARYIDSAKKKFETNLFNKIGGHLTSKNRAFIDHLLNGATVDDDLTTKSRSKEINLNTLKKGIPGAKLNHVQFAVEKYKSIRTLWLPDSITTGISRKILLKYYERIMAYSPSHIKELDECAKYAMVTIFCHIRSGFLADSLGDLFVKLVRKIEKSSESYVNKTLVNKDTIYPVVDIETLRQLKEDLSQRGNWYKKQVRLKMRSLYSYGSRTDLLDLLTLLKFNARDNEDVALLAAVNFIIKHRNTPGDTYKSDDKVPLAHVIPNHWLDFVVENREISINARSLISTILQFKNDLGDYTTLLPVACIVLSRYISLLQFHQKHSVCNKFNYEMVVCSEVRKKLTYKGIWIDEGYRYRDPKKDLPPDFEENKAKYYKELGLPIDVREFINPLKDEVGNALSSLNETILANDKVTLSNKNGGHIKISPSLPQKLPENIVDLHNEIIKRWGHINLIDAFKEANIRIGFTRHLETVGKYSNLDTNNLVMRLLLSLYSIGSNTGLKRISIANPDANETELQYVKRRFINPTNVKLVIREVINAVIKVRDPAIFGKATTTVACDSKKLNSWDQNLMTEWHGRYKGHGVMVYGHVDTNALCIHSQSKTCTSSEVGAMIKGVLEHSTKMDLKAAYVDTHGQSTIGFGKASNDRHRGFYP